jgi:hypothetical protein
MLMRMCRSGKFYPLFPLFQDRNKNMRGAICKEIKMRFEII